MQSFSCENGSCWHNCWHNKNYAGRLAFIVRFKVTRKWPINNKGTQITIGVTKERKCLQARMRHIYVCMSCPKQTSEEHKEIKSKQVSLESLECL